MKSIVKVPVKIVIHGDERAGRAMIGFAKVQVIILEKQMSKQNLKQGSRTIKPSPGVIIDCWSCFNLQQITITVPSGVEKKKDDDGYCLCFPCFALGVIESINSVFTTEQKEDGYRYYYDVSVCNDSTFILFENQEVKSAAWGIYFIGQYVLISVEAVDSTTPPADCCSDKTCLVNDLSNTDKILADNLIVTPIFVQGMQKWQTSP